MFEVALHQEQQAAAVTAPDLETVSVAALQRQYAATADLSENVCFIDGEQKGSGIDSQLHFGKYISLLSEAANQYGPTFKPIDLYQTLDKTLRAIPQNKFTVCVLDNIAPIEEALLAEVKREPRAYGIDPAKAISGAFGGAWPGVNNLVSGYCNALYAKGIRLIIATAHIKAVWASGGQVPNKFKPKGVERWQELSILSLVLIPGDYSPVPSALVMKEQLGQLTYNATSDEFEIRRRLPQRLPKATFAEIRRYLREPADLSSPLKGEVPTDEEIDPFNDKFSKDQLAYMRAAAEAQLKEDKGFDGEVTVSVKPSLKDLLGDKNVQ